MFLSWNGMFCFNWIWALASEFVVPCPLLGEYQTGDEPQQDEAAWCPTLCDPNSIHTMLPSPGIQGIAPHGGWIRWMSFWASWQWLWVMNLSRKRWDERSEWVSGVNSVNKRTLGKGLKTSNHDFSKGSSKGLAARSVKSSIERGTAFGLQGKADKKRWWKVGAKNRRPFAMERCLLFNIVALLERCSTLGAILRWWLSFTGVELFAPEWWPHYGYGPWHYPFWSLDICLVYSAYGMAVSSHHLLAPTQQPSNNYFWNQAILGTVMVLSKP